MPEFSYSSSRRSATLFRTTSPIYSVTIDPYGTSTVVNSPNPWIEDAQISRESFIGFFLNFLYSKNNAFVVFYPTLVGSS